MIKPFAIIAVLAIVSIARAQSTSSLTHYRAGQALLLQNQYQDAANSFRECLGGDLQPKWTEVWAHIGIGEIFSATGQLERAINEYRLARRTGDNTFGAQDDVIRRLAELGEDVPSPAAPPKPTVLPDLILKGDYTNEALAAELEGIVILEVVVGPTGSVDSIAVSESLGLGLDESAIHSVRGLNNFDPAKPRQVVAVEFFFPSKSSRWHLTGVTFDGMPDASRVNFQSTNYPKGAGIALSRETVEHGSILSAIGRPATVTLSFAVDEKGHPTDFAVEQASDPRWGIEAIAIVREWRFKHAGEGASRQRCSIHLIWGPRTLTPPLVNRSR